MESWAPPQQITCTDEDVACPALTVLPLSFLCGSRRVSDARLRYVICQTAVLCTTAPGDHFYGAPL
jgi:hypothetical protein